jgi:hypothetical protein
VPLKIDTILVAVLKNALLNISVAFSVIFSVNLVSLPVTQFHLNRPPKKIVAHPSPHFLHSGPHRVAMLSGPLNDIGCPFLAAAIQVFLSR